MKDYSVMQLKNGMELVLRQATEDDAAAVVDFLSLVSGESDNLLFSAGEFNMSVEDEKKFLAAKADAKTSAFFIGRIGDEVVCFGNLHADVRKRIAHSADVALAVKKKYWGIGIGKALMQTMIDFAKSNGKTEILHLGVRKGNTAAYALYQKMGFEEIGIYKNFFKIDDVYDDEILMNLYL